MKKSNLMPTIVLGSICLIVALVLAVVNIFTEPIIIKAQEEKAQAALREVMPEGEGFEEIDVPAGAPAEVVKVYRERGGGYVVQTSVTGYKPGLVIMCGVNAAGEVTGNKFIASGETMEAEIAMDGRFAGYTKDTINTDIVAGPTAKLTTGAYYRAVEASLKVADLLRSTAAEGGAANG